MDLPTFRATGRPLVVLDTETTGLSPRTAGVVEVAAVVLVRSRGRWRISDHSFFRLCHPGGRALRAPDAARAFAVNRIPLKAVLAAEGATKVAHAFRSWLDAVGEQEGNKPLLSAYNLRFDRGFLDAHPWCLSANGFEWGPDAMEAAMRLLGCTHRLPLCDAAALLGIKFRGEAHRALADAEAAGRIVLRWLVEGDPDQGTVEEDGARGRGGARASVGSRQRLTRRG